MSRVNNKKSWCNSVNSRTKSVQNTRRLQRLNCVRTFPRFSTQTLIVIVHKLTELYMLEKDLHIIHLINDMIFLSVHVCVCVCVALNISICYTRASLFWSFTFVFKLHIICSFFFFLFYWCLCSPPWVSLSSWNFFIRFEYFLLCILLISIWYLSFLFCSINKMFPYMH